MCEVSGLVPRMSWITPYSQNNSVDSLTLFNESRKQSKKPGDEDLLPKPYERIAIMLPPVMTEVKYRDKGPELYPQQLFTLEQSSVLSSLIVVLTSLWPALEEAMEYFPEFMEKLLEIQSGERHRSLRSDRER